MNEEVKQQLNNRSAEIELMQNGMNQTVYVVRYFENNKVVDTSVHESYTIAENRSVMWYGNKKIS
jgi:hypothetical protein